METISQIVCSDKIIRFRSPLEIKYTYRDDEDSYGMEYEAALRQNFSICGVGRSREEAFKSLVYEVCSAIDSDGWLKERTAHE